MRSIHWIALVAMHLVCFFSAEAKPCQVTPSYTYYAVEGRTVADLQESLRQRGPRDDYGAVRFAYTDWSVKWSWKRKDDGTIDLSSVKLVCDAMIKLPKIEARESLPQDLVEQWDGFVERTTRHELNHVSHVEQGAPQILERLDQAAKSAGNLTVKRADSIVRQVIAEIRAKDREYDATTTHGRTEGTWRIESAKSGYELGRSI
jgi:predicted secreted Zn-dependent protease